ncbi:hypothetical protein [Salinarimonas sp.]|uniref:hypothetical protein n=1 Tax=Salinarimonas sp. TaxID=2766526 RepID=UPI0032D93D46
MKLADLLPTIAEKSQAGKLAWEELGTDVFTASLTSRYMIEVRRDRGRVTLALLNDHGRQLESVGDDYYLSEDSASVPRIFDIARRQALAVDDALSEAKRALESL